MPTARFKGRSVLGDLRKLAEQHGDIIQWEPSIVLVFSLTVYWALTGDFTSIRFLIRFMTSV